MVANRPTPDSGEEIEAEPGDMFARGQSRIGHGSVLIAAITSCTNTSNPSVMLAAGLLAKKAVERGLHVDPAVKTSLAPGSRVVSDYLQKTGLQTYLDQLGFNVVGYGCTTCIGNSGPLHPKIEQAISEFDLVAASVLSGNRNFEARVHQNIKANFLMSPPLVVAFALAGRVDLDLSPNRSGRTGTGRKFFCAISGPVCRRSATRCNQRSRRKFSADFIATSPAKIRSGTKSRRAPATFISGMRRAITFMSRRSSRISRWSPGKIEEIRGARPLGIFGDSVTTDHISPAGAIKATSPAGQYLMSRGIKPVDFNSYGSRRGNDLVMTRGTFANVRIKNLMVPGTEGGVTKYYPERNEQMSIFDAAMKYQEDESAAGHSGGPRIRHRFEPRLGGERDAIARRESGGGGELRADSSLESRRHGRVAVAICRWHECADARPGWLGDIFDHRFVGRD